MSVPELTTVIVSWNSGASVASSLRALERSADAAGAVVETVVVDNASSDDSAQIAAAAGADRVVRNPVNAGYVVAASQGIALARGAWIMLANPDLTVSEAFVGTMLDAVRSVAADVACLVPDIRYAADPLVVNSRGIEVDTLGIPAEKDAGRSADDLVSPVEVFGPSTSGCLIRRSALAEIGGLEPMYFAYLEDVDLGWRLRKKGYRSFVVPAAVALHEGSASTGEGSWLKAFLVARNRRALFRLHAPTGIPARPIRALTDAGHATVQAASGTGNASIRGRVAALRTRRYTRFLRASNKLVGIPDDAHVELVPRQTLEEALRRKRAAASLMHRGDGRSPRRAGPPVRPRLRAPDESRPLRVLVDATNLKPGQGGIRTYTFGLVEALAARPELELVVAASVPEVSELGPMELVEISAGTRDVARRAAWRERNLAGLAQSARVDVVLSPVPELPLRRLSVPTVIVVHDVGPLVAPAFYDLAKRLRYQTVLPRACRMASAVVCVSHATLMGLHSAALIDPARCEVIGEGPQLLGAGVHGLRPDSPYLLYVGSLELRKNVETLLEAVLEADPPLEAELVIVGPVDNRLRPRLRRQLEQPAVRHLGFVSPDQLADLYRGAIAVALPSVYEGFGLPVLEAMTLGAPVVSSDISPIREVARDAALYVERPLDPACWREALRRIVSDDALRAELSRRGSVAAVEQTWSRVAARFSVLLHRVGGRTQANVEPAPVARAEAI